MNGLVTVLLGNTVLAAALAVAALAASLLRRPAVAHVLWALVLVKLLTPALVRVEVPGWVGDLAPRRETSLAIATTPSQAAVASDIAVSSTFQPTVAKTVEPLPPTLAQPVSETKPRAASMTPPPRIAVSRGSAADPGTLLLVVWAIGTLAWIVRDLVRLRRLAVICGRSTPVPPRFAQLVAAVAQQIGLRRVPQVRTLPGDFSPMVLPAFGRAVLIVPASLIENFSAEQQRAIVAHELAHLYRGDHWIRVLEALVTALMWWHPLLWLARRGLHEAEEQCCDAWVVALLPEHRRTYADALVDVLERTARSAGTGSPQPTGLATGLGRMTHLRRRLTMIVDRTPPKSLSGTGRIAVVLLVAILPLAPVRGDDDGASPSRTTPAATKPASAPLDDATRKAVESLLEMAQDENQQAQMAASEAIARFGARAVPVLIEALAGREKSANAAQALLPRTGVEGIEGLIEAIGSNEPAVRERALLTLESVLGMGWNQFASAEGAMMGGVPGAAPAPGWYAPGFGGGGGYGGFAGVIPAYPPQIISYASWATAPTAKASTDSSPAVRRAAVRVLAAISRVNADPTVVAALGTALKDPDSSVRGLSAAALINVARAAPQLATALAEAVGDSDQNVRIAALTALGAVGPAAKDVMPTVTAALKDPNSAVRIAAANALGAMQSPQQQQSQASSMPGPGEMEVPAATMQQHQVASLAQNIFHWTKLARYDLAKADADRLLKLQPNDQILLGLFQQVAQDRNEDLKAWTARLNDVKEMQPLAEQITAAFEQFKKRTQQPAPTQPASPTL